MLLSKKRSDASSRSPRDDTKLFAPAFRLGKWLSLHAPRLVEDDRDVGAFLRRLPKGDELPQDRVVRDGKNGLRLRRVDPVVRVDRRADLDARVTRAKPEGKGTILGGARFQEREEQIGRFFFLGRNPRRIDQRVGVVRPKRPLERVDRDQRRVVLFRIRLDDQIFVEDRRREIGRPALEHFVGEKPGRFPVMDDRLLDLRDEVGGRLGGEIGFAEVARFLRAGIRLGEDGEKPGVRKIRMAVPELELPPLRKSDRAPTLRVGIHFEEIAPRTAVFSAIRAPLPSASTSR